jgi:hypothetical protein
VPRPAPDAFPRYPRFIVDGNDDRNLHNGDLARHPMSRVGSTLEPEGSLGPTIERRFIRPGTKTEHGLRRIGKGLRKGPF